jgi:ribosomal protein S18 acetylase RimI-like enzyme
MMPDTISIRPFVAADLPAARAVWRACEGLGGGDADDPHDSDASWQRFATRNAGHSFVAETAAGDLVGTIMGGHDGRRGIIYRLAVAPTHRRLGIARRLSDACVDSLRYAGLTRVLLFIFDNNAEALSFWERYGARHHTSMRFHTIDCRT